MPRLHPFRTLGILILGITQYASHTLSMNHNDSSPMFPLSGDSEFDFYLQEVLSLADGGGANTGEVLRVATSIAPKDFESVYKSFHAMAEGILSQAKAVNSSKDPVGAREAHFRAATYFRGADFFLHGNWSDPRINSLWDSQLASFDTAISLLSPIPGHRFTVKAHSEEVGHFETIGVFYKAAAGDQPAPTVIVGTGYDGSQEELYHSSVREILARGLNVVTYEGPGQPTVRRQQGLGFISDWWSVVTPVVDWLEARSDVDQKHIALIGLSFGGILAPRAAAREPRISAVVAIDGFSNFTEVLAHAIPSPIVELYVSGNKDKFDATMNEIAANASSSSSFRWLIDQSLWSFNTHSAYEWWSRLSTITMDAQIVRELHMPVFVAKGQDDLSTANQPEIAYKLLQTQRPNGKQLTTYHEFLTRLGAGEHCSVGAESQLALVVLDWLGDVWGGMTFKNGFN